MNENAKAEVEAFLRATMDSISAVQGDIADVLDSAARRAPIGPGGDPSPEAMLGVIDAIGPKIDALVSLRLAALAMGRVS